MRHGTATMDSRQFAQTLDFFGGRMAGGVTIDSSIVSISGVAQHLWRFVDMATEVALNPLLSDIAIAAERIKALQIHRHEWDQIENMVALWLARTIYGDHPYGLPRTTAFGLKSSTSVDLRTLHESIVDPRRGLILVAGPMDVDSMVQRLSDRYGSLPSGTSPAPVMPSPSRGRPKTVIMLPVEGSESTVIGLGMPVMARNHPDYLALRLANQVFGGSASSRLFSTLRDKLGLCYGAYSTLDCGRFGGDLTAIISMDSGRSGEGFDAICHEFHRMSDGDLSAADAAFAKRFLVGSFPQRASGLSGMSSLVTAAWLHDLPQDLWSTVQTEIHGIRISDLRQIASKWFDFTQASWVVAGPDESLAQVGRRAEDMGLATARHSMADLEDAFC
jgi:zinc protease